MTTRNTFRQNVYTSLWARLCRELRSPEAEPISAVHSLLTLVFPWTWLTVAWKWSTFSLFFLQNPPLSLNSHQDENQKNLAKRQLLSNTLNAALPGGVRCARTKCTAVCVSSHPLAMFPLPGFSYTLLLPSRRNDSLPSLLPKAHLFSDSWLTMWEENIFCLNSFGISSTIPGFPLRCTC